MNAPIVNLNDTESTDALFDTSPDAMAKRIGASAAALVKAGDLKGIGRARLAASYALMAQPDLCPEKPQPFSEQLWKFMVTLTRATNPTARRVH